MASSSGSYGSVDGLSYGTSSHLFYNADNEGQQSLDDSMDEFDARGLDDEQAADGGQDDHNLRRSSSDDRSTTKSRVTNRIVVAYGSMGLILLTFCTFFLVLTANRRGSTGSWGVTTTDPSYSATDTKKQTTATAISGGVSSVDTIDSTDTDTSTSITATTSASEDEDEEGGNDEGTAVSLSDDATEPMATQAMVWTVSRCNYSTIRFFDGRAASAQLQYAFLADYAGVIEPYVDMDVKIILDNSRVSNFGSASEVVSYAYFISDTDGETVSEGTVYSSSDDGTSDSFSLSCSPKEKFTMTVTRYSNSIETTTQTADFMCMYVRREFRSLSADDLSASLDAMHTLWEYSSKKGKSKFGDAFESAAFFADVHNYNAGWRDSDHIHEGLGFLPQHVKMTNMFEAAMQAVDPSVSLFYWDFTIDTKEGLNIYDSPYFSEDIFGSISTPANITAPWVYAYDSLKDARIPDGRWKDLQAEENTKYPELWNAFGYMRAPWNMNPNKYISRFATTSVNLPGCGNYKTWFEEKDFEASMKLAAYGPHSTAHTAIGGVYGCDVLDTMLEQGLINSAADQIEICLKWGFYIKEYYRGNYLTPSAKCTKESSTCFTCNEDNLNDMKEMMKGSSLSSYVPADLSEDQWNTWRDFVCEGSAHKIFVGDHLESASPADPSFWPIHPTQERLLQARFSNGGFWDFDWPEMGTKDAYVCNHFECYDDDTLEFKTNDASCCYGHYEYDKLYYPGDRSTFFGDTNRQVLEDLDAGSEKYGMTYIYDSFYWDHCGDTFDVEKLADVLALQALSLTSAGEEIDASATDEGVVEEEDVATSDSMDEENISWGKDSRALTNGGTARGARRPATTTKASSKKASKKSSGRRERSR